MCVCVCLLSGDPSLCIVNCSKRNLIEVKTCLLIFLKGLPNQTHFTKCLNECVCQCVSLYTCVCVCVAKPSQPSICASSSFCQKLCKNCSAITNQMASQTPSDPAHLSLSPLPPLHPLPSRATSTTFCPNTNGMRKKVNFKKLFQSNLAICCCLLLLTPIRCHCFYGKARQRE